MGYIVHERELLATSALSILYSSFFSSPSNRFLLSPSSTVPASEHLRSLACFRKFLSDCLSRGKPCFSILILYSLYFFENPDDLGFKVKWVPNNQRTLGTLENSELENYAYLTLTGSREWFFLGKKNYFLKVKIIWRLLRLKIFFSLYVYKFAQVESRSVALQNILKPGSGPGPCGGQGGRPESDLIKLLLPFFSLDFLSSASCSSLGFPEDCSTPRVSFSWLTLTFHLKLHHALSGNSNHFKRNTI